jgi:hypothetical protein
MNRSTAAKLLIVALVMLASTIACAGGPGLGIPTFAGGTPGPVATETLIPAFVATSQSAVAGAQATTAFGQAQMSELSVRATAVSLELTAAAATEQHAAKQTEGVRQETQRAYETASAQSTQAADNAIKSTQTAVVQAGLDAAATADAVRREAENAVVVANANAEVERIQEQRVSEAQTALFRTWGYRIFWSLLAILAVVACGLLVQSAWQFRVAIMVRLGLWRFGPDGKGYVTVPVAGGGVVILDPTRQFGPALAVMPGGAVSQPGILDVPLQAQVTARSQAAELLIAANTMQVGAPRKNPLRAAALGLIRKDMEPPQIADSAVEEDDESITLPDIAPWELLQTWQGQTIPLGVGKAGPLLLDPLKTPHLLIAATSGAGKTMCGLRPITAAALARGQRVILLNDAGGDFAPLLGHPNLVTVDETPAAIADALESVAAEVGRRSAVLKAAGVSTWSRLSLREAGKDDSQIMVVIDELVALATMASPELRRRIWAAAIAITSKGRKMGISFVGATTDPTHRTLGKEGLTVRDNCGRVAFRMRDGSTSQAMFDARGAEGLAENQFLAMLTGEMTRGVAFHPSDDELRAYVQSRPVQPLSEWRVAPQPSHEPVIGQVWSRETIELAQDIEEVWRNDGSKREMARSVGKEYAGSFCAKLDQAIEYLESATTTSDLPAFGG